MLDMIIIIISSLLLGYVLPTYISYKYCQKCYYDVLGCSYGDNPNSEDFYLTFIPVVNIVTMVLTIFISWKDEKYRNKENDDFLNNIFKPKEMENVGFTHQKLGTTEIDISGKRVKVAVSRLENGNIEITPLEHTDKEGDFLWNGTCTEGYNDEIIISKWQG